MFLFLWDHHDGILGLWPLSLRDYQYARSGPSSGIHYSWTRTPQQHYIRIGPMPGTS